MQLHGQARRLSRQQEGMWVGHQLVLVLEHLLHLLVKLLRVLLRRGGARGVRRSGGCRRGRWRGRGRRMCHVGGLCDVGHLVREGKRAKECFRISGAARHRQVATM
jgi:hypothetical protein